MTSTSGRNSDKKIEHVNILLANNKAELDRSLLELYLDETYNGKNSNPIDWDCIAQILTNQTHNLKIRDPID